MLFCMSHQCVCGGRSDCDDSEDDDDEPRKPVPEWARGHALWAQLQAQFKMDPDEIFQQHKKTCALNEVFGHAGAPADHLPLCAEVKTCMREETRRRPPHLLYSQRMCSLRVSRGVHVT